VVYEFQIVAGPGPSMRSLVDKALVEAESFFGSRDLDLTVVVEGQQGRLGVRATATSVGSWPS